MEFLGSSVWLRATLRSKFTGRQVPFTTLQPPQDNRLFEDCSDEVSWNHGAPPSVYCLSGNGTATDFLMVFCETVTICPPNISLIRLQRFYEVPLTCRIVLSQISCVVTLLSSRRRRCWRRPLPRKAATYQLMAPSQSAVSLPHR